MSDREKLMARWKKHDDGSFTRDFGGGAKAFVAVFDDGWRYDIRQPYPPPTRGFKWSGGGPYATEYYAKEAARRAARKLLAAASSPSMPKEKP